MRVHRVDGFSPEALATSLRGLAGAAAASASSRSTTRSCARRSARPAPPARRSLTLVSDIANAPRVGYVGIDNRNAGRLAGHLLGRFVPGSAGEVALFAGSLSYRGHEEREMGFRHILADEFPGLRIVELREVRDDLERSYKEASALLAARPGLRGIYNIGAGNRGIAQALEEAGRGRRGGVHRPRADEHTRRFLLAGTMDAAIDQNPRVEAREAIDRLLRAARGEPDPGPAADPHPRDLPREHAGPLTGAGCRRVDMPACAFRPSHSRRAAQSVASITVTKLSKSTHKNCIRRGGMKLYVVR